MKKILVLALLVVTSISYAQSEYIAYPSAGKGVSSTFVTDYHALGINPANLGWQQYPEKKFTTGSTEFGLSMYSSALSKQDLRDNIWGVVKSGSLDTLSSAQKIQAAQDFAGSDFAFNFDNNIFGFSFQTPKFGGIALSIRTRASWNSNFNIGRIVLYELTRHSDHHYKSSKKYQLLNSYEESPTLPLGYPASILLSYIPFLWFKVMNPLVPEQMKRNLH